MPTEDLHRVHRRYIRVSSIFKSAWTFHQFLQGVRKLFSEIEPPELPADFQTLYSELKLVSGNLSETSVESASSQLDRVEEELEPLTQALLSADEQLSPGQLRQFFKRVKSYDDAILTHLVKFYLISKTNGVWSLDRLDKADFLTTKLVEEYSEGRNAFVLKDPTFVREAAQSFWVFLGAEPVAAEEVAAVKDELKGLDEEFRAASSVDDLYHRGLIAAYRELKHRLGDAFFQPDVLRTILEVNLDLKNQIRELYHREEPSIIAEYQQIFELEREVAVDMALGEELTEFRSAVDRFENQIEGENVRLAELAQLRQRVRDLVPKLQPSESELDTDAVVPPPELRELAAETATDTDSVPMTAMPDVEPYLRAQFDTVVKALDDTNSAMDARRISLQPEVFDLGIEPREIIAYRRLFSGSICDRELEELVLRAAALRVRIEQEVEEIKGIIDDTAIGRKAPQYVKARETVRLADAYLRKFDHRMEMAVFDGDGEEARALQVLKMRMMRGFSGLWLMACRE
jgi:hypothetical protein